LSQLRPELVGPDLLKQQKDGEGADPEANRNLRDPGYDCTS